MTKKDDDKKAAEVRKEQQATFEKQAEALSHRANIAREGQASQTGPAQGHDPAVAIRADVAGEEAALVEQNQNTGPAQEPVHRVAEPAAPTDPASDLEDVSKAHDGSKMRPVKDDKADTKHKKSVKLSDTEIDQIADLVKRAYENLSTETMTDGAGRQVTAQYQHVSNQAAVVLQFGRGDDMHQTVLATSGLPTDDPEHVRKAVKAASEHVK